MANALVGTPVSSYSAAATKTVVSGNLVVFCASGAYAAGGLSTPVSSGAATTGTWSSIGYTGSSGQATAQMWWAQVTGSGSLTVTAAGTTDLGVSLYEVSGVNFSSLINASNTNTGSTAAASVSLTGVVTGSIIIMIAAEEANASAWTPTSPYQEDTEQSTHSHTTISYIVPSDNNYTPTTTQASGPYTWAAVAAAFNAAADAVPPTVVDMDYSTFPRQNLTGMPLPGGF